MKTQTFEPEADPGREQEQIASRRVRKDLQRLRTHLLRHPRDVPALHRAGELLQVLGRYEQSLMHFKWALDLGTEGVMVPWIRTAADAEIAVAAAKYPPQGIRGVGVCRAHGYGARFKPYVDTANDETLVILQIEHIDAVNDIEAICAVPGVDVVFVGPYDLSGSMGLMGQIHHPDVEAAVSRVFEAATAAGVAPGLLIAEPGPNEIASRIAEGFQFIAVGLDTLMIVRAAQDLVGQWRAASGDV